MNKVSTWSELFFESLTTFGTTLMSALPGIFGALLILFFGWLFAKLVSSAINRILKAIKFN